MTSNVGFAVGVDVSKIKIHAGAALETSLLSELQIKTKILEVHTYASRKSFSC